MTQTPTRILPRPHGHLPKTTHLHKVEIKNLLWQNPLSTQTQLLRPSHKCPARGWLILYALLQVPLSTVYMDPLLSSLLSTHPADSCSTCKRIVVQKTIGPRSSWSVEIYTKKQSLKVIWTKQTPTNFTLPSDLILSDHHLLWNRCTLVRAHLCLCVQITELQYPRSQSHLRWRP